MEKRSMCMGALGVSLTKSPHHSPAPPHAENLSLYSPSYRPAHPNTPHHDSPRCKLVPLLTPIPPKNRPRLPHRKGGPLLRNPIAHRLK